MTSTAIGEDAPLVLIVDDDVEVRTAIGELMESVGIEAESYGSTRELLDTPLPDRAGCLVLDVRMPGSSGLDLQQQLATAGISKPIVFLTGHGDIPMSVRAMKAGAVDFLPKPFRDQDMLDAVAGAIERDAQRRADNAALDEVRTRYATLTPREREVMAHVASGLMNKQVAGLLELSEITVKIHRGNVMRKMGVRTLADLVRQAEALALGA